MIVTTSRESSERIPLAPYPSLSPATSAVIRPPGTPPPADDEMGIVSPEEQIDIERLEALNLSADDIAAVRKLWQVIFFFFHLCSIRHLS